MAERNFDTLETLGRKKRVIAGSFAPDSGNAPTDIRGKGFTVAYVSTGLFRVTFTDAYSQLNSATATLQLATGDDKDAQIGAYVAANKTLDIRVWDASGVGVADVSADANNRVNFVCVFDDALEA